MDKEVLINRLAGNDKGIVLLTMNRPKAMNAFGRRLVSDFLEAIEEIKNDHIANSRVVIINSALERAFCTGADLKERKEMKTAQEICEFVDKLRSILTGLEALPQPVIASIDGYAMGGGCELSLAADLRVAGCNAQFALTETKLAIIPGAGGTQRLPRLIGIPYAKEMIMTGKIVNATEAYRIGLVNAKTDDGVHSSMELALNYARQMLETGPLALRAAKQAINRGMQEREMTPAFQIEREEYLVTIQSKDKDRALQAFKESTKEHKVKPVYEGD
eukprot:CAMPEP_0197049818 /NCGR_PEP_ID=MMETSP1384-20130603/24865_1 /TAXON_ID=29189 /ORGANISM="Ammonia sp." /LENGTH=274 /DNA_ID=CAMNT_0042482153 /DNA_START=63 /DNA_END=887 /DNA_ORIENTATION=+